MASVTCAITVHVSTCSHVRRRATHTFRTPAAGGRKRWQKLLRHLSCASKTQKQHSQATLLPRARVQVWSWWSRPQASIHPHRKRYNRELRQGKKLRSKETASHKIIKRHPAVQDGATSPWEHRLSVTRVVIAAGSAMFEPQQLPAHHGEMQGKQSLPTVFRLGGCCCGHDPI